MGLYSGVCALAMYTGIFVSASVRVCGCVWKRVSTTECECKRVSFGRSLRVRGSGHELKWVHT